MTQYSTYREPPLLEMGFRFAVLPAPPSKASQSSPPEFFFLLFPASEIPLLKSLGAAEAGRGFDFGLETFGGAKFHRSFAPTSPLADAVDEEGFVEDPKLLVPELDPTGAIIATNASSSLMP